MAHKNKENQSPYKARQALKGSPKPKTLRGIHKKPDVIYDLEEANNRLQDIFKNHDFDLVNHEERKKLAHFYVLLMREQKKLNLTRLLKFHEIAIKHFIDSIYILKFMQPVFPLLDMGTGPGFPGIPLKIKYPHQPIFLGEGVQKRVEFLKLVRKELELQKLDIFGRNINEEFIYPMRSVITRAVEDISNTLRNVSGCLDVGGRVYFMKGPGVDSELKSATHSQSDFKLIQDVAYTLPQTDQHRRLLIFERERKP